MIDIRIGESVPTEERITDVGLSIRLPKGESETAEKNTIQFKIKFQNLPGMDYDTEAKSIETSVKGLLKLSKSLNYTARHILDEFDVAARISKESDGVYFVLDVFTTDPKHYERIEKIIDGLRDKEHDEHIEIKVETNFDHIFKLTADGKPTKLFYNISSELHQATKESITASLKDIPDVTNMLGVPQIIYLLSLRKLKIEADVDFELCTILPKELQPSFITGLAEGSKDVFFGLGPANDMKLPLTTSMKKIGVIIRDKMESHCELSIQVGKLSVRGWLKFVNLYDRVIKGFIDL